MMSSKNKSFTKIKDYFNKNIDINKIVASSKSISVEMDLNISLATKILKKLEFYSYFFQKGAI